MKPLSAARAAKRWTAEDDQALAGFVLIGMPDGYIASVMGRSYSAVKQRRVALCINRYSQSTAFYEDPEKVYEKLNEKRREWDGNRAPSDPRSRLHV